MNSHEGALKYFKNRRLAGAKGLGKRELHQVSKAHTQHKRMPEVKSKVHHQSPQEKAFKSMTQEEYIKKYNPFND